MLRSALLALLGFLVLSAVSGCQTVYYGTMEKMGVHKRDILVDRVKETRDAQADASEQFKDALEQFSSVVDFEGGNLEKKYNKLNAEFERCEGQAHEVRDRVASIESVAQALFKEWKAEIKQYTNQDLRRASEQQLRETQAKYDVMIASMKKVASSMDPVLAAFRDQVLFLKHNLNARAISSIQQEADQVKTDVNRLIKEMEASIAEADAFIKEMGLLG